MSDVYLVSDPVCTSCKEVGRYLVCCLGKAGVTTCFDIKSNLWPMQQSVRLDFDNNS